MDANWLTGLLAEEAHGVYGVEDLWVRAGQLGGEGVASSKCRTCKHVSDQVMMMHPKNWSSKFKRRRKKLNNKGGKIY